MMSQAAKRKTYSTNMIVESTINYKQEMNDVVLHGGQDLKITIYVKTQDRKLWNKPTKEILTSTKAYRVDNPDYEFWSSYSDRCR